MLISPETETTGKREIAGLTAAGLHNTSGGKEPGCKESAAGGDRKGREWALKDRRH
jgi:hypothetical protein